MGGKPTIFQETPTCWSLESQKRLAVDFLIQGLATPESLRGKEFRCSGAQIFWLVENHRWGEKLCPPSVWDSLT